MLHTLIGMDLGQSDVNVSLWAPGPRGGQTTGRVERLTFPSVIGSGDPKRHQQLLDAVGSDNGDGMILVVDGVPFFVGELGYKGSNPTSGRGDADRYSSGHTRRLMLAAFGRLITSEHIQNGADVRLVTGLPLEWYTTARKRAVQRSLGGKQEWVYRGQTMKVTVRGVGVVPEGPAALHRTAHLPKQQCSLDIGWGTTEAFWAFGAEPDDRRSRGKKTGVGRVADEINAALQLVPKGGRPLSDLDMRHVLRAYVRSTPYPRIVSHNVVLTPHLDRIVPAAVATVTGEVTSFISTLWGDERGMVAEEAEEAVLSGGGAYFFGDAVRNVIPTITISEHPEFDNADAYLAVARVFTEAQWNRNRGD